MAELYLSNSDNDGEGVLFCSGEHLDDQSTEQDAVLEMLGAFDDGRCNAPMCQYGYNWNLEEVKQIHAFLGDAIAHAEISNEYTD